MAFAEFDGIRALLRIQTTNDEISGDFLKRTLAMQRIRAGIYLSGTYVRDFLLEPDPRKSELDRAAIHFNGWFNVTFKEFLNSFYHIIIVCTDGIAIGMCYGNFLFIYHRFTIFQVIF